MTLSVEDAKALVIEFCATYPVASTISYKLRETQEELYGPKATREPLEESSVHFVPQDDKQTSPLPIFVTKTSLKKLLGTKSLDTLGSTPSTQPKNEQS